jgi:hypothetical protein
MDGLESVVRDSVWNGFVGGVGCLACLDRCCLGSDECIALRMLLARFSASAEMKAVSRLVLDHSSLERELEKQHLPCSWCRVPNLALRLMMIEVTMQVTRENLVADADPVDERKGA